MNYSESVHYLYGLGHEVLAAKFRLENIRILLEALGNPQKEFRSILVAGTNGKGSVSAMLEAILREAGYRTGLYTSPHLVTVEERMRVVGEMISEGEFASGATLVRETSERLVAEGRLEMVPTFFEQVTAIALNHFKESVVKIAVLEVGLGGRLDATNAVDRILSVITAIDFDHQKILGETIEEIAAEKAAIIMHNAKAVIGRQRYAGAEQVLRRRCDEVNVFPSFVKAPIEVKLINFGQPLFEYESSMGRLYQVKSELRGRHQAENAATAVEACEAISQLGFDIDSKAIIEGLANVCWPGRLEVIGDKPLWLLDGAHNPAGAKVLNQFLSETWKGAATLIFAVMRDKSIEGIANQLFSRFESIILTRVDESRAATVDDIQEFLPETSGKLIVTDTVEQAIAEAQRVTPRQGLICVAGSLYLVGAVKKIIQGETEI
jgi:dihydrofolate synthase/folylpolyglutamate synthase